MAEASKAAQKFFGSQRPIAIAHRGGAGNFSVDRYQKENTLETFKAAKSLGYKYFEIDVTLTADGRVVVLHVTTDRFEALLHKNSAPDAQKLQRLTYKELKEYLKRQVPTLREVLDTFPTTKLLIDPKTDEVVEPLAKEIISAKAYARVYINSFYLSRIVLLQKLLGNKVSYGLIIARYPRIFNRKLLNLAQGKYREYGLTAIVFHDRFLDHQLVDLIHHEGFKALVWSPNSQLKIEEAINLGVDGIISDRVELLKEVVESKKDPLGS